ncbi:MAG: acyl-phosphate glycerol 3-phosphate acyltransferase [Candidatus Epulonipiscioides saccharophilum]|nr:MAG: acyl-phosphate glycerol 3-phosphate acyltransferase [Epulopiscium sp. AS2M-Bin001]
MYRIIMLIIGYLLGSIQFSIIYSKYFAGKDIREQGSGNAGSTNVIRIYGKRIGISVFCCDFLKAALAVLIARIIFRDHQLIAALYAAIGAIIGHSYPLYFGFKGGKGVAVTVGSIYTINLLIGIISTIVFYISLKLTRMVSLSSMLLTSSVPICLYFLYRGRPYTCEAVILGCVIAGLTIFRHHSNIARIINGTESKTRAKNKGPESQIDPQE